MIPAGCTCHGHWWSLDDSDRFSSIHDDLGCVAIRSAVKHLGGGRAEDVIAALERVVRGDPLGSGLAVDWLVRGAPLDDHKVIAGTSVAPLAQMARRNAARRRGVVRS